MNTRSCDSFGPALIWSPDFQSPTSCPPGQTIPIKLFPQDRRSPSNLILLENWSPKFCSPWTNGPQPIWFPHFRILTACPSGQMEYSRDNLSRRTKLVADHLSKGNELAGNLFSRGTDQLGTNCGGPYVFAIKGWHSRQKTGKNMTTYFLHIF